MLKGRLGLETARIPHVDRHGLLWLNRGKLYVEDGTLHFATAGMGILQKGDYTIPFQMVTNILIGPGCTVSHDALRLLARHGTGLIAVGEDGVRFYASMPFGAPHSKLARQQVRAWIDEDGTRITVARKMYAMRLGELVPHSEISVLRGIEGARMKELYQGLAQQYGIEWRGRFYDRSHPDATDVPNQAINHAATAVEGAAMIAAAATGMIPQLGFIHEDAGIAFVLDIADLYRDSVTIPAAFAAVKENRGKYRGPIERAVRKMTGKFIRRNKVVPGMIDRIKELFDGDDSGGHE